jgi:aminoglycoside phosphotransferase (APT) family kinase protein
VQRWAEELTRLGYSPAQLGAGVEGAVFNLGNGAVAKVWNSRSLAEVKRLASFYRAVATAGLPFATPEIHDVRVLSDAVFSIERELPGRPLHPDRTGQSPPLDQVRLRCVAHVLEALAAVTPTDAMKQLPVLDDSVPLRDGSSFNTALGQLIRRRLSRSIEQVRAAISDVDNLIGVLERRLETMPPQCEVLLHGDLIPANILVDEHCAVTAVLDFGFFSTVGPPEFDAAVVANIFDMYGPKNVESRAVLGRLITDTFAYSAETLTVYLAAYALATITVYGANEQDGHFHWCAEVLRRPDIVDLLTAAL